MIAYDYPVMIGDGHRYIIRINSQGKVTHTACLGRWPMTSIATGDPWLDSKLQEAATAIYHHEQELDHA